MPIWYNEGMSEQRTITEPAATYHYGYDWLVPVSAMYHHPDDEALMKRCMALAKAVADQFGHRLRVCEHKRRPSPSGASGLCYQRECRIAIIIRYRDGKVWWKRPCSVPYVLDTVIHEVAHLPKLNGTKGLPDGKAHKALQAAMREWAVAQGLVDELK